MGVLCVSFLLEASDGLGGVMQWGPALPCALLCAFLVLLRCSELLFCYDGGGACLCIACLSTFLVPYPSVFWIPLCMMEDSTARLALSVLSMEYM